uniref:Uncharacterized protein n=1 Tax=Rhizophora mucronata TaxID=61149 RepID=A0A2P2NL35_RHIMU
MLDITQCQEYFSHKGHKLHYDYTKQIILVRFKKEGSFHN